MIKRASVIPRLIFNYQKRYIFKNMEQTPVKEEEHKGNADFEKLPYVTYREYYEDSYRVKFGNVTINIQ